MARIFYDPNSGAIYGTHRDGNVRVPEGLAFVDVPGAPDQVAWPVPPGRAAGREKWSRVNPATQALELLPSVDPDVDIKAEVDRPLIRALVAELLDIIDARHPSQPIDRVAFRRRVIERHRDLTS